MMRMIVLVAVCMLLPVASRAGQAPALATSAAGSAPATLALPANFAGPQPPELPDTIARDEAGRVTVRAVRLTEPFHLDGRLDEAVYREIHPASDFVQTEPKEGAAATEKTEMWVVYDNENVYIG